MNLFSKTSNKSIISQKKTYNFSDNFILGKDESLQPKFTKIFGISYTVNVYYLKIQSPELNLEKNCININLPMSFRKNNNQELLDLILLKMYTKIAETEIENIMEKARYTFGFAPEDYEIKKTQNTIAVCNRETQSITINPNIVKYPKAIIEYIVFHEFCHLKYKTHSQKFYDFLEKYVPNYKNFDKQLSNLKY